MRLFLCGLAAAAALISAGSAAAGVYRLDVAVTSEANARLSAPFFTFTNNSSNDLQVSGVGVFNGPPWDWVANEANPPYQVTNPAGGTRTLLEGEEADHDTNDGVTPAIRYGLTSFDPGDFFRFSADPEAANGTSAVIDIRPFMTSNTLKITASFAGGPTLTGSTWTLDYINPNLSHSLDSNQVYRLTLEQDFADPVTPGVPEPAAWALTILGFGGAGAMLRRRAGAVPQRG